MNRTLRFVRSTAVISCVQLELPVLTSWLLPGVVKFLKALPKLKQHKHLKALVPDCTCDCLLCAVLTSRSRCVSSAADHSGNLHGPVLSHAGHGDQEERQRPHV